MKEEITKLEEAVGEVIRLLQRREPFTKEKEKIIASQGGGLVNNLGWWRKDMKKAKSN
ncbi:MAG: hypothetical protein OXF97_04205 [Nitrospira sp.]|nr:hypothetical protein [Nitrospira sp.]